jgi:hypothetical protein
MLSFLRLAQRFVSRSRASVRYTCANGAVGGFQSTCRAVLSCVRGTGTVTSVQILVLDSSRQQTHVRCKVFGVAARVQPR